MIDWIWDNRQWLFSGIGVAVIAVVWRIVLHLHRRAKVVNAQGFSQSPTTIQQPTTRPSVHTLSAQDVLSHIRRLPPLQEEDSFNSFKGARIRYVGLVNRIRKGENNTANLELYQPDGTAKVVFSVHLSDYPELKHIQPSTPIVAEGALRHLSSSNEFHLDSVVLSHPPNTPSVTPGVTMDRTEAYTALHKLRHEWQLDPNTRDAIALAMSWLFPECHGFAIREWTTSEQRQLAIETLTALRSKRTDVTEQRAIEKTIDFLRTIPGTITDT